VLENRIRTIVTAGSTLSPEEDDLLKDALSDISTLRFFTRYARGLQWLKWAESQTPFKNLFLTKAEYSEVDLELSFWFAHEYAIQHWEESLDLVRRNGRLSRLIWQQLSLALFRGKPHGEVLSKWVTVLVATAAPGYPSDALEYILSHCVHPDDEFSALLLFEYLTRPQVHLKESLRWLEKQAQPLPALDVEVECPGAEHWLAPALHALFLPNLGVFARRLAQIVSSHLSSARLSQLSFGKDKGFRLN
jgi:hypothetical protein